MLSLIKVKIRCLPAVGKLYSFFLFVLLITVLLKLVQRLKPIKPILKLNNSHEVEKHSSKTDIEGLEYEIEFRILKIIINIHSAITADRRLLKRKLVGPRRNIFQRIPKLASLQS